MTAFATELKRAMTARRMSQTALAKRADYGRSPLRRLIDGEAMPTPEVAERLAEALDWPGLMVKLIPSRSGTCALCDAPFITAPRGHSRRYCSQRCKRAAHMRNARAASRVRTLTDTRLTKKRLSDLQAAVDRMCQTCEPEGLCRDAECPLRPVSPLRLASVRVRVA